ncbi:MAG TPA: malto-oligosyltrehalose trehalohydrolase, partial [Acidimicrobiales bacterium]|nr:malto-oligosyltrehalose trehalohydrolase [Acidimicrobiales bacterium]
VELVLDGRAALPMGRDDRSDDPGWWALDVPDAGGGTRYRYSVDGGTPRADPRSAHQPEGPEGPSELVDHSAFPWTDGTWRGFHLPSALLYEMHVGTFTPEGTFAAAVERLDHLCDLGVTAVELMPVAEFPGAHGWGYDGVDLYAPHHAYGGPDGLKELVDACHGRGLAVVMDVVYNHLGPSGNYLPEFGPYFTDSYTTPWGTAINFDGPDSEQVRRFFVDNALMWLRDYHCDALRIDAVHAILDISAFHILEQLADEVERLSAASGWRRWLTAESDLNDPRIVQARAAGGYGIDAQWSDDFHHAIHTLLTGERDGYYADFGSVDDVAHALSHAFVYDGRYSRYRRRRHGRPVSGLPGWAFVGFSQNHDQVGNRATGQRLAGLVPPARLKMAAALVLLAPFVPMLFQGEEWAASSPFQYFTDHPDPDLGRAVSAGRRREFVAFGWDPEDIPDPQDPATFLRSKLDWSEVGTGVHAEVLAWYRALAALRRAEPDLTDGDMERVRAEQPAPDVLLVRRGRIGLALNLGPRPARLPFSGRPADVVLASAEGCGTREGELDLPPESVVIVRAP